MKKDRKKFAHALGNRVFLKKDKPIEYKGEIYLPKEDALYAPPYSGEIISVGPDVEDKDLVEGVRVGFHDMAGVEFEYDGNIIFSIREHDITCILEK